MNNLNGWSKRLDGVDHVILLNVPTLLLQQRRQVAVGGCEIRKHLQGPHVEPGGLSYVALLPLHVAQVVERVHVGRAQQQGFVVALLGLGDQALLLEGVGEVAVGVWEIGLQSDRSPVRLNRQVYEALFVV